MRFSYLNAVSNEGWTPVNRACFKGHLRCVSLLVENGCDVNIPTVLGDTSMLSFSRLLQSQDTASQEDVSTILLLMNHGADLAVMNSAGKMQRHFIERRGSRFIQCPSEYSYTV